MNCFKKNKDFLVGRALSTFANITKLIKFSEIILLKRLLQRMNQHLSISVPNVRISNTNLYDFEYALPFCYHLAMIFRNYVLVAYN